jgi:hypothetical protein
MVKRLVAVSASPLPFLSRFRNLSRCCNSVCCDEDGAVLTALQQSIGKGAGGNAFTN